MEKHKNENLAAMQGSRPGMSKHLVSAENSDGETRREEGEALTRRKAL